MAVRAAGDGSAVEGVEKIVVAVGEVDEAAILRDDGVAAAGGPGVSLGQQFDALDERETAVLLVPAEHIDGGNKLIHAIGGVAVGMEVEGARTGAGRALVGASGGHFGGCGVGLVDVDAVAAKIVDVGETIIGREGDEVGVGGVLAGCVGPVEGVVLSPDGAGELAVGDGEAGCASAHVVGGDEH